jgi:hypothetical protein
MESTAVTASAGLSKGGPTINAETSMNVYADGSLKATGITFFENGRSGAAESFGHETLHVIYADKFGRNEGWHAPSDPQLHQESFDNAARF